MISAWWLLLALPAVFLLGMLTLALCLMAGGNRKGPTP